MPKTLLLADDSVTIQKVVGISFASEDITLVSVDNGTSAVAKAKEVRPDIVLADVVMPGLNGYEVCRQIKADPNLRHVPVLLLTGTFEAFDEVRAREVGSDGHITKPFEAQALVDLVTARLAAATPPPAAAPAPAAGPASASPLFGEEEEPFDFMSEEITEPSQVGRNAAAPAPEALSFGTADELEMNADDELDAPALEVEGMTQVSLADADSGVAPLADDEENAETLPPVEADAFDDEAPAATRVLFAEDDASPAVSSSEPMAATRVMFGEPRAAGVGTITPAEAGVAGDPFADMIGGARPASSHEISSTDLGDPFADEPELTAAPSPATTVLIAPAEAQEWPAEEEEDPFAPEPTAQPADESEAAPARVAAMPLAEGAMPGRDELRNMLEKMAWEAFGDVTDRIVRETVQRVEQIAWEVIPKMAETLIREEIRKLKEGED
ncbi:MAG TPA: response regulator [Myxococcota bacterium]|nr:response regulator [Myxococcota bacterium]